MQLPKPASSMISVIYLSVTARHDIILHCFSYDFFMGYLHQNKLLCKVCIIVFLWTGIYCHVMWEVYVVKFNLASSVLHICIFLCIFLCIYQKHDFVQICTACKSDTRQKCTYDVICHVIFHIVFSELKLYIVMISVITVEIWCTYMLYSNIVLYWKSSYVKV